MRKEIEIIQMQLNIVREQIRKLREDLSKSGKFLIEVDGREVIAYGKEIDLP
jgi:hypothetical protein